jgi:hypothetical protein
MREPETGVHVAHSSVGSHIVGSVITAQSADHHAFGVHTLPSVTGFVAFTAISAISSGGHVGVGAHSLESVDVEIVIDGLIV